MKYTLLLIFTLTFSISKSQISEINLKDFINKNHLALRGVHKYVIHQNNQDSYSKLRELLIKQENAVKLSGNKEQSLYYAFIVRKECLVFLKQHSKGSLEYFELTDSEKKLDGKLPESPGVINSHDLEIITNLNLSDAQSLNQLTLTIQ